MTRKIPSTTEAWENGELGEDEEFVKLVEEDIEAQLDEALQLQLISVRLQKSLIEDLKAIAEIRGIGYQPLLRQILLRFVDCEKKTILREKADQSAKAKSQENENEKERARRLA